MKERCSISKEGRTWYEGLLGNPDLSFAQEHCGMSLEPIAKEAGKCCSELVVLINVVRTMVLTGTV
jgi:hypothetical protein